MEEGYLYPLLEDLANSESWLNVDQSSTPFAEVFNHAGLLTDQLKLLADNEVVVQCVSQKFNDDNTAQRRDVALLVDGTARVLASTIIPDKILQHYPSLLTLGNQPIGEHLEDNYGAKRAAPKFRTVLANDRLNLNFDEKGTCYLRKYSYVLDQGKINIVELFSPKILNELAALINSENRE